MDPFSQHDDAMLNDALRASGLFSVQHVGENSEISLDTRIASGGGNLSTGQRQIIALARALVRQSKLLILDEGEYSIYIIRGRIDLIDGATSNIRDR